MYNHTFHVGCSQARSLVVFDFSWGFRLKYYAGGSVTYI